MNREAVEKELVAIAKLSEEKGPAKAKYLQQHPPKVPHHVKFPSGRKAAEEFDYGRLPEVILDSFLLTKDMNSTFKAWGYSSGFSLKDMTQVWSKATIEIKTPKGIKKFKVVVSEA